MLVATPKTEESIKDEAKQICDIIATTQLDQQPALYRAVAKNLAAVGRYNSAQIFRALASGEET